MIEDLFLEPTSGHVRYTAMGETQLGYLSRYGVLIGELAEDIRQDAVVFDPAQGRGTHRKGSPTDSSRT